MLHARRIAFTAALAVAGLGLSGTAFAQDGGAQVFNFGGCMSEGQPEGFPYANEGFGPLTLVITPSGEFKFIQPPGVSFGGPAERPEGNIGCPPSGA